MATQWSNNHSSATRIFSLICYYGIDSSCTQFQFPISRATYPASAKTSHFITAHLTALASTWTVAEHRKRIWCVRREIRKSSCNQVNLFPLSLCICCVKRVYGNASSNGWWWWSHSFASRAIEISFYKLHAIKLHALTHNHNHEITKLPHINNLYHSFIHQYNHWI